MEPFISRLVRGIWSGPRGTRAHSLKSGDEGSHTPRGQRRPCVHGEYQASDQVATVLMLLRVERELCCTLLSLLDVPTTATLVADQ